MRYIRWIIAIAVPIILIMLTVRIFTLSWYPVLEYKRAGFPEDPLGMPDEERLRLATACIHFLNARHDTGLLASLRFSDGSVVFNQRELEHMEDVKIVYDRMTLFAVVMFILAVLTAWYLLHNKKSIDVYRSLSCGGFLTLLIFIFTGVWMLVGFDAFFTRFHSLFFSKGTWVFYTTDALIRLFPLRFWQDAGLGIAIIVIFLALLLSTLGRYQSNKLSREQLTSTAHTKE